MIEQPLLKMRLRVPQDVFLVRQLAREVAREVGLEQQDQTRIGTALSEVSRVVLSGDADTDVTFAIGPEGVSTVLRVSVERPGIEAVRLRHELGHVGRLVDKMEVEDGANGTVVWMARRLPASASRLTPERLEEIRAGLARHVPGSPLDELNVQNQQLIAALDEVRAQRDELARLNAELEETNRGVMALYHQLSEELEETNRGVVALYAELDEKSEQLAAASEAKSRFLANVSHELRAPVTAVIGLSRLLGDESSDPLTTEQRRQVDLIRGSASDLLTLVNDLLDLAKAEAGRIEPQWEQVDLKAVFGQLRGTLRPLATRPEVDFVVDEPAVATIRSDEVLLTRVLRNLLTNALKFTAEGEVRLTVRPADDDLEFAVTDTGTGIPVELHERVFEEFYQVPGSKALSGKGTGLGLPYARRLAGILGGALRVDSTPGEGSTFTLRLPSS
ncbi:sensor histidine kinase [Paractinoplanes abujensis]|uniref:histidine kinase n=1 Tax=Paractinoplanes abujensis TaxID=882441 RepID=A0A7W7G321_9ACTN|nr:sensor histidine kinase [Actinoplanes abujensis]MBB4695888.1 signal transduction histidine kinase [Actinoplanes abujensis]GID23478.1 sensor histidine kinase [Actinoplanes abujensis]